MIASLVCCRLCSFLHPSTQPAHQRVDSSILFGTLNRFSHCQRSYLSFVHECFAPPVTSGFFNFIWYSVISRAAQQPYLSFIYGCALNRFGTAQWSSFSFICGCFCFYVFCSMISRRAQAQCSPLPLCALLLESPLPQPSLLSILKMALIVPYIQCLFSPL